MSSNGGFCLSVPSCVEKKNKLIIQQVQPYIVTGEIILLSFYPILFLGDLIKIRLQIVTILRW